MAALKTFNLKKFNAVVKTRLQKTSKAKEKRIKNKNIKNISNKALQVTCGQRGFLELSLTGQVPAESKLSAVNPAGP